MPNHTKQDEARAVTRHRRMLTLSAATALVESAQPLLRTAESYLAELPGTAKDEQLANDATFIVGLLARLRSSLADRLQAEHFRTDQFGEES